MSRVFQTDPAQPERAEGAIAAAAEALASGGLVVFPTETVLGIAARPDDPAATSRLFDAKRRPAHLNLPVLAPTTEAAWALAVSEPAAQRLAWAFWPGPLTLVLPRSERSRGWVLGDRADTIGVRVPDHPLAAALLHRTGPLAATSANLSGEPPLEGVIGLQEAFGSAVDVYIFQAPRAGPPGRPSTVVSLSGGQARILRRGALDDEQLRESLRGSGSEVQWVDFD